MVNLEKSFIYFGKGVTTSNISSLRNLSGMRTGGSSLSYLGINLFQGAPRKCWFQSLADKIRVRLEAWNGQTISLAGRRCLISSIIQGTFLHSFQIYKWPKTVIQDLTKIIRNFFWSGKTDTVKQVQVAWRDCCRPIDEGGLGLRDLRLLNEAMLRKFAWRVITGNSNTLHYLRSRYLAKNGSPRNYYVCSSVWPGLRPHYLTLLEESRWLVGRNSTVKFWTDNWLGTPLIDMMDNPPVDPPIHSLVGDYLNEDGWHLPQTFMVSYPDIASEIQSTVVGIGSDTRVWTRSIKGDVTASEAYDSLRVVGERKIWGKAIWAHYIPPSRSILLWRAIQNKLPTDCQLKRRGQSFPSRCSLCGSEEESLSHLFLSCHFAGALWDLLCFFFGKRPCTDSSVLNLWTTAMKMEFGSQLTNLWKAGIVSVIWVIWNTRNDYRFTNKKTTMNSAFATVWRFIREASLSKSGCMKNTVDDLQILKRLRIPGIPRRAPRIIEVNWKAPPSGWIKVNTDGAAFGAPGLSGCAGVFRTSRSFVKGCFCVPLGILYAFEAELAAAIYAVKYAYMFGWRRLWLESDSAYVVALLQTRSSSVPWKWYSIWKDCLDKISHMEFHCSHIYREGNAAADSLASRAPSLCTATWWWNAPSFASSFIYSDANNKPNYRFC